MEQLIYNYVERIKTQLVKVTTDMMYYHWSYWDINIHRGGCKMMGQIRCSFIS